MRRGKASVVWELWDIEGAQRLVVDVDAPLRPFGADPTPPHGIKLPGHLDEPNAPDAAAPAADEGAALPRLATPRPTAEVLLRALRARSSRT